MLNTRLAPAQADRVYLRILKLAADGFESEVATSLEQPWPAAPRRKRQGGLLATSTPWDDRSVAAQLPRAHPTLPALLPVSVNLSDYDRLLGREVSDVAA